MGSHYEHVFAPIRIRGRDFKNRITLAPPSPNHADHHGWVTREFVDWFRQFARGGAGILYVGNTSIDITESKDEERQLNMTDERCVLPLSWYAEMAQAYGCHASMEINHNGKDTAFETIGRAPYSASGIITSSELTRARKLGRDPIPAIEMSHEKIRETVEKFAVAARRMQQAGMDIVLVHGAHGNLISQFTSPLYNKRTDEYGGSTSNRARFALEVCDAIRGRCGEDFVIEYRISADEIADEGMHFDETLKLIGLLKDHIDILHVSAGLHSDFDFRYYRNWCQNYMMPHMFNVPFARSVKERYPDLLVTTVGSITSLDEAEEILANGWADFVAMCRPLMADPEMPRKYAEGNPESRRPCLRCDQCALRLFMPRVINCAVNPLSGLTTELPDGVIPKAPVRKKVGIVGGGPAGLYALMAACERGHEVILFEKTGRLGGNLVPATAPPLKQDMRDYLAWLEREVKKYCADFGAAIRLNTEATPELLDAEKLDALIVAVGADPIALRVPGAELPHVHWAADAEAGTVETGRRVVIVGAGAVGIETALMLVNEGHDVALVEADEKERSRDILHWSAGGNASTCIFEMLEEKGVPLYYETKLAAIEPARVRCVGSDGKERILEADTVLYAIGMRPRWELADRLRRGAPETSVRLVGDALQNGVITNATNSGFQAGLHV
jgi:2,4-dienoyl-CoA reductase-like NADH-dependent reductase (Old Yellow Enzyme family)/thioredoxin reductase